MGCDLYRSFSKLSPLCRRPLDPWGMSAVVYAHNRDSSARAGLTTVLIAFFVVSAISLGSVELDTQRLLVPDGQREYGPSVVTRKK